MSLGSKPVTELCAAVRSRVSSIQVGRRCSLKIYYCVLKILILFTAEAAHRGAMSKSLWCAAVVVALAGAGCDLSMGGGTLGGDPAPSPPPSPSQPERSSPASPDAATDSGFPCDVRTVLEKYCAACHYTQMYSLASPFATRAVFLAPWGDAGALGEVAAAMVMTEMMPPSNVQLRPTAEEKSILIDWVAAGMPPGPCGPLTAPGTP